MGEIRTFTPRPRRCPAPPSVPPDTATVRVELEQLGHAVFDIVERIVTLLDRMDGDADREDGGDAEPDLGAPEGHGNQIVWLRGTTRDLEQDQQQEQTR